MRTLLLAIAIIMIAGCQMPQREQGTPSKMPDGKWVSFSWFSSDGGGMRNHLGRFAVGAMTRSQELNSKQFMHERYLNKIRIPALTGKEWQDNFKAQRYWIGKYGALPK